MTSSEIPALSTYLIRHKDGISVFSGHEKTPHFEIPGESQEAIWSPDGRQLASSTVEGVVVYTHPVWDPLATWEPKKLKLLKFPTSAPADAKSLRHLQWSPRGNFLVGFWQYVPKAVQNGYDERNVFVWATAAAFGLGHAEASPVAAFTLKALSLGQWPILKWRNDEKYCCLSVRSELVVFNGRDLGNSPLGRIPLAGIVQTELAPARSDDDNLAIAAFSPTEGSSTFRIIEFQPHRQEGSSASHGSRWSVSVEHPVGSADSAEISWNSSGDTVLVLASTTIDSAGENYGGVGDLYLARRDTQLTMKVNTQVAQEARWSPVADEFILIQGKSPSDIQLYDSSCNLKYVFPSGYRNTIRWDAWGHMLALGGFGNLAGDLSFWYRDDDMKHIAEWREPCTVLCAWDPSCQFFFTASTWPRMRVDNQVKIYDRRGDLLAKYVFAQLFDFQWKPALKPIKPLPCPTPQTNLSAPVARKFRPVPRDLPITDVVGSTADDERKRNTHRGRRDGTTHPPSGGVMTANHNATPGASTVAGTATTCGSSTAAPNAALSTPGPTITTPTGTPGSQQHPLSKATATAATAQAMKNERSRQLDSINDWRAGERLEPLPARGLPATALAPIAAVTAATSASTTTTTTHPSEAPAPALGKNQPKGEASPIQKTAAALPLKQKTQQLPQTSPTPPPATTVLDTLQPLELLKTSPPACSGSTFRTQPSYTYPSVFSETNPLSSKRIPAPDDVPHGHSLASLLSSAPTEPTPPSAVPSFQGESEGLVDLLRSILPPEARVHVATQPRPPPQVPVPAPLRMPAPRVAPTATLHAGVVSSPTHNSHVAPPLPGVPLMAQRSLSQKLSFGQHVAAMAPPIPRPAGGPQQQQQRPQLQRHLRSNPTTAQQLQPTLPPVVPETSGPASGTQRELSFDDNMEELRRIFQQTSLSVHNNHSDPQHQAAFLLNALLNNSGQQRGGRPTSTGASSAWQPGAPLPPQPHHPSRPDPMWDTCWEYVDPTGIIRGPFTAHDMRDWFLSGFLKPSLPVRCCATDPFTPLGQLYQPGTQPFAQPPSERRS